MNKFLVFILLFLSTTLLSRNAIAQDPQFTQFYAASTYLNPAFAGNTLQHRVSANYRNQWPSIPGAFVTYNFAYDVSLDAINSGLGLLITHDKVGTAGLHFTNINLLYSYNVEINRRLYFRPGIQFGYNWLDLDYSKLIFSDQLVRGQSTTTSEIFNLPNVQYFDISAGGLFYGENYWVGFSAHHLNKPNQSVMGDESPLPVKYSVHGGYRFTNNTRGIYNRNQSITAAFNYKAQEKFDQLDIGAYYSLHPMVVGVWYRGIPLLKAYQPGYQNNDAVALLIGYEVGTWRFGYSYDITISRLFTNTAGSHEISVIFEWASEKVPLSKKKRIIPCAKF